MWNLGSKMTLSNLLGPQIMFEYQHLCIKLRRKVSLIYSTNHPCKRVYKSYTMQYILSLLCVICQTPNDCVGKSWSPFLSNSKAFHAYLRCHGNCAWIKETNHHRWMSTLYWIAWVHYGAHCVFNKHEDIDQYGSFTTPSKIMTY